VEGTIASNLVFLLIYVTHVTIIGGTMQQDFPLWNQIAVAT